MREIRGDAKKVGSLLGRKFAFDYNQREYRWEKKQVTELPGFRRFLEESGLEFRSHSEFKKADMDALEAISEEKGVSVASLVRQAVKSFLKRRRG